MKRIENERFGEERALYGSRDLHVLDCRFSGEEDGESAFKESVGVVAERCLFDLRYPFWHNDRLRVIEGRMSETCRAPFWYCNGVLMENCVMHGTKAVRECSDVHIVGGEIVSEEFGWFTRGIRMENVRAQGAYFLLKSRDVCLENLHFSGKYSFQYVENVTMKECVLDTKDALWHARGAVLTDCVLKGEYVAWYSEDLTLIRCRISGTQPFCYCKNLKLIDCELTEADLAFEKSEVEATLTTHVESIKNPLAGSITLPSVGEWIMDDPEAHGAVHVTGRT